MDVLTITNLNKSYPGFQLKNVSLSLPKGYILGFVGENGAGKTTTINSMLNITKRDSGIIKIFGKDIDQDEIEIKKNIGYISGEIFYPKKQIKQVTNIYKRFYDSWDEDIYRTYLTKFKLDESKKIDQLSKGMYLKYVLALALSHHASLLVLDEPTTGLDPVARDNLLEIFQSLVETEEVSIFYSTHITTDLEKCADFIAFIKEGVIIEHSSKDDLLDRYRLVNGSKESLKVIKNHLISYKENAFGFNGLMKTDLMIEHEDIRYAEPSIDDIIIFFSERRDS
ncbi:MAG: ABC transporter ATP-binding protein [Tenericutes bacterium HGW-Tenericutes-1]|jgi:ABC-2 type transport system ATP-binding protein|nr:MAG: ABC transporter ATP-binding protein [Tenericutes bacterium HGW-Tenericutes-1]